MDRMGYLAREFGFVGRPIFGARASFSSLGDDLILYAAGRYEQLEIWRAAGELHRIVRWQSRDRAVGPEDAEAWRRQRRAELEARSEIRPEMEPIIEAQTGDHIPVAELYPAHGQVVVSHEGDLWVEEYRRPRDEGPARWLMFRPDAGFVCSVSLPGDLWVMAIRDNRVFGLATDSLDVEYVLGYDVRR